MILRQQRLFHTVLYSMSFLQHKEGTYRAFVVEDPPQDKKIPGKTRIPAGLYELVIRKQDTPLTIKHRNNYNKPGDVWFEYHIEIIGIPNFKDVYVHVGKDQDWTEGCITPGYTFDLTKDRGQQDKSYEAVKDLYKLVYPMLKAGKRCWIEIKDEE